LHNFIVRHVVDCESFSHGRRKIEKMFARLKDWRRIAMLTIAARTPSAQSAPP
jgi:hypothetical protein